MKLLNLMVFILAFTVEVKVKAESLDFSDSYVSEPEGCISEYSFCTVRSLKRYAIQANNYRISMNENSVITREKPSVWSFVNGQLFVKTNVKISFKTPYGEIELAPQTQALIEKSANSYTLQVLQGSGLLKGIGHKQSYKVLAGYENSMAQVTNSMKSEIGIPKLIVLENLIKDWSYHYAGRPDHFDNEVEKFKPVLENAKKQLSEINQAIVQRELASVEMEKKKKKAAEEAKEKLKNDNQNRILDRLLGE